MPCRSPGGGGIQACLAGLQAHTWGGGGVEGSGWGKLRGLAWGVSRPTPWGVSRPTLRGVSRPTLGGGYPSMH